MAEWRECSLESVCSRLSSGKGISAKLISESGGYPVYGGNGIRGYTDTSNFKGECAIVGRQGAYCGNVRYFRGEAYMTEHAVVVCANEDNCTRYLAYLLATMNLGCLSAQSAQPGLSVKTLGKQEIRMPDKKVQLKCAELLGSLDEKISHNEEVNKNLLHQTRVIFKHWFTDNPNLDTMKQATLADLCLVVTKGTTPTTLGKTFASEGINFIKAESILDNHAIDKEKFAFIDSETNDLLKRSIISSGDIVFTIAGTLGRFALIDDSVLPANTNQAVAIIRANQSKVTPEYLYSFFLGNWHNDYYTKRIQQAVQANLSLGTIKSLPIPILSDKAMSEYLGIIKPIIAMTKANELEITRLRAIRDALLPQLMSGTLDVSNLDL